MARGKMSTVANFSVVSLSVFLTCQRRRRRGSLFSTNWPASILTGLSRIEMGASQINSHVKLSKVKKRTIQIDWFVRSCCVDQCRIVIGQENKLAWLIQSSDQFHYIKLIPSIKETKNKTKNIKLNKNKREEKTVNEMLFKSWDPPSKITCFYDSSWWSK